MCRYFRMSGRGQDPRAQVDTLKVTSLETAPRCLFAQLRQELIVAG